MDLWRTYRSIIERNCAEPATAEDSLEFWRNKLFSATLAFLIPLALIALIPGVIVAYEAELYVLLVVDITAMITILGSAFLPSIPLYIRKIMFSISIYAVSVTLLYYLGLFGPGLLYLLAISVFIIFIFNQTYAFLSVVINVVICVVLGVIIYHSWGDSMLISQYQLDTWIAVVSNLIFLNILSVLLIPLLFNGLQNAISEKQKLTDELLEKRKHLEESLQQLKAKNEELEDFAYTASHDLKEPLRMVKSFLGLLEKKYKHQIDKKADQYIHFAVDGADRMQHLIEDLLEYSRVGRHHAERTEEHVADLAGEAIKNLTVQIEESGAEIILEENLPVIQVVKDDMVRVFQNLISNAIKFRNDEQNPVITIGGEKNDHRTAFWVKDNGIGIPEDKLHEVFDIFKRLNSREKYPGTGVGLAICRKILDHHNGIINAESKPGEGSTFIIELQSGLKNEKLQ